MHLKKPNKSRSILRRDLTAKDTVRLFLMVVTIFWYSPPLLTNGFYDQYTHFISSLNIDRYQIFFYLYYAIGGLLFASIALLAKKFTLKRMVESIFMGLILSAALAYVLSVIGFILYWHF